MVPELQVPFAGRAFFLLFWGGKKLEVRGVEVQTGQAEAEVWVDKSLLEFGEVVGRAGNGLPFEWEVGGNLGRGY